MFELRFGTMKPIRFRECWERNGFNMDLDLEAPFGGKVFWDKPLRDARIG